MLWGGVCVYCCHISRPHAIYLKRIVLILCSQFPVGYCFTLIQSMLPCIIGKKWTITTLQFLPKLVHTFHQAISWSHTQFTLPTLMLLTLLNFVCVWEVGMRQMWNLWWESTRRETGSKLWHTSHTTVVVKNVKKKCSWKLFFCHHSPEFHSQDTAEH